MASKIIDNRYEVLDLLGKGIWGEVYKVIDLSNHQQKALKIITNLGKDTIPSKLLKEEFRRLTKLHHPHIVTVHDFSFIDKVVPYFTMEYMAGGPLTLGKSPYNEPLIYEILARICLALQYIHSHGYIHGDIKPDNILLGDCELKEWNVDQKLPLKLSDFSFAEMTTGSSINRDRPLTGTVMFLPLEKFFQSKPDYRSDLYSLGVLLYYLTTGSYPHTGNNFSEFVHNLVSKHPVPPTRLNAKISDNMEFIVLRLLEKEPLKRFQSAQEILNLLGSIPNNPGKKVLLELSECAVINDKFIGREDELTVFRDLLATTEEGRGQSLFMYGESGVGCSRLAREMKILGQLSGFKAVLTKCEPESSSSFKPLRDILTQLGFRDFVSKSSLAPNMVRHVMRFLESGDGDVSESEMKNEVDEPESSFNLTSFFEEHFRFLEAISSQTFMEEAQPAPARDFQPLLVIIEDCHLAHATLLEYCEFLIRNCEALPLLFCLTFCDDDLIQEKSKRPHSLFRIMELNNRNENFRPMRLSRLSLEETSQMVTQILEISSKPGAFVKKIHELSDGIPLHIQELLHFMLENNILSFEQGNWWISDKDAFQRVPSQLQAILEKRYERLSELHKGVLQKASYLPEEFSLDDLMQLTAKDPTILSEMLDDFIDAKIIDRLPGNNEVLFRFSHPVLRQLIFSKIKGSDKVDLHLKTSRILEKQVEQGQLDRAGLLSFHLQAGAEREKAREYALRAAEYAGKMYNFDEQVNYLERARTLSLSRKDEKEHLELLEMLANAYFRSNRIDKARDLFEEISKSALVKKDRPWASQLARKQAKAYEVKGDYRTAREIYSKTLALYGPDEIMVETVELKYLLGWTLSLLKEYKKAKSICSSALNDAKVIKSESLMAKVYLLLGKIAEDYGNHQSAEKIFRKALNLYRSLKDEAGIAVILNNMGTLADKMGDSQKAIEFHKKSLAILRKHYNLPGEADSLTNLGSAYALKGEWEKSLDHFQQALNIFKRLGNVEGQSMMHHNLGELYLRKGEFRESHQQFNIALKMRERLGDEVSIAMTHLSLAGLSIQQNEYESGLDYLSRSLPIFKRVNLKRCQAVSHRLMAEIYVRQENLSHALREINRARKLTEKIEDSVELGNVLRLFGEISLKLGDAVKAEEALYESVVLLERVGAYYELGLTYLFLAEEQLNSEKIRQAGISIEKAAEIFHKFGTPQLLKKVESLKQELNARLQPLYFQLPSDQEQLKSLIRISHLINSTRDLDHLLEQILDIIIKTLKADRGAIFLKDRTSGRLQAEVIRNLESETIFDAEQLSTTIMNNVVLRGEPVYITDTKIDSLSARSKSVALYGIVAIICVPLKVYDDLIGVVYLDSRSIADIFIEKDLQYVASFANIAALALANGIERKRLVSENISFRIQNKDFYRSNNIIAHSKKMQNILKVVAKIASSSSTVLLTGASGTGKEIIAKAIHNMGSRRGKIFMPYFCGNAPETLIDSELFGHVKGAFSGAINNKKGIFEETHEGTVFLDEISEIGPQIQAKLLRFLQEKEIKPLGSNVIKKVDVRIIAATNKDLEKELKSGTFRNDLYYRLKVIHIHLPPLVERKEDIAPLAHHFLQKYNHILSKKLKGITKTALQRLSDYLWPGNVRELENQIELAVNMADDSGYIDEALLSDEVRNIDNLVKGVHVSGTLKDVLAHMEREMIVSALMENKGNKSRAARRLGVTRQCLNQKLKNYKIY